MLQFEFTPDNSIAAVGLLISLLAVVGVSIYRSIKTKETQHKYPRAEFGDSDPDIVIIGGGFAGATLASVLGAEGRRIVVIERDMSPPDTYRGENMTPGGMLAFDSLGLKHLLNKVRGTRCDGFIYNDETINESASLPLLTSNGYMMRHGDLVDALRKHANAMENVAFVEAIGKDLIRENGRVVGVTYKSKGSDELQTIRAPLTVICDGYYSTLRKQFVSLPKPESVLGCIGLEMEGVYCPKGKHWLQVFLGNPLAAYFVYSIGEDAYRILIEVLGDSPKDLTSFLRDQLAPTMPDHIKKPVLEALEKRNPSILRVKKSSGTLDKIPTGVLLVGDVLDSRDPISGSGMTAALRDIVYWRDALRGIDLADDGEMMKQRAKFGHERHSWAWMINTLSHVFSILAVDIDVGACRIRQQFIRALKKIEGGSNDEKRAIMDILNSVNTDPATLKTVLESTRKDTIKHAFESRSWTNMFSAIREAIAIHFKFNEICGAAFKTV